jgi:iron complex outermembrane receptor protein
MNVPRTVTDRAAPAACALVLAAATAAASESPGATPPELGEIVVSTSKLAEPLRLAAASVRVVTDADLERAGVSDFEDLAQVVPALTITKTTQPANNTINVRGIGTYAFSIAVEPSVLVVVDDVPQSFQAAAFTALVDVRQVEVLRGPQSTTFGKAATAGVIRVVTAPVTSTFTGRATALQTDDHERRMQLSVSGPATETLGYRVSANFSDFRGTLFNLATGHWLNGQQDANVRAKFEWRPDARWSAVLSPFWTRSIGTCCAAAETFVPVGATTGSAATGPGRIPAATFLRGIVPGPDNRRLRADVDSRGDSRHSGAGLRVERRGERLAFLALSSFERYRLMDRQDTDTTDIDFSSFQPLSPPGGSANGGRFDVTAQTQELRVQSSAATGLRFAAGTFWSRTRATRTFVRGSNTLDDYSLATPPGVLRLPVVPASLPTTNDTSFSRYDARSSSDVLAAFAQATVPLASRIELLAGARWSRERIGYRFHDAANDVTFGQPRCSSATPSGLSIRTCDSDGSLTGRVGLRAMPSPEHVLFVTYARGHKGRAFDLSSTLTQRAPAPATSTRAGLPLADVIAATQPIAAESVDDYEVGSKNTLLDGRATLDVTAFHMVYRNLQAQSRDLLLNQNLLNSVPRVTSSGVEAELSSRVGRLTLNAAGAYNRARIVEFRNASCYRGQSAAEGCVGGVQDLAGQALPNAPRWSLNAQAQYGWPVAPRLELVGALAWRWQSATNFSLLRDPASAQSAYAITNLSIGVRTSTWTLTAFANNVFDRRYLLNGGRDTYVNNPSGAFATSWRPAREAARTLGLRGSYEF